MSPKVYEAFLAIALAHYKEVFPSAVLEVGATKNTLLDMPCFAQSRRVALNVQPFKVIPAPLTNCEFVVGNSNNLPFSDSVFDCVMSCSVLEHDKYFWKSVNEIYRVLKPGGIFIVGVPIYMTLPTDMMNSTLTFRRHGVAYNADYYRFSEQAVREVILGEFIVTHSTLVRRYPNPSLVMAGTKPND